MKLPGSLKLQQAGVLSAALKIGFDGVTVRRGPDWRSALAWEPKDLADLVPQDGDYLKATFRAISSRYLGEQGYHLDFSRPGVLQAAVPLFLQESAGGVRSKPLKFHRNHSDDVQDVIGLVDEAWWSDGEGDLGIPGVNVLAKIDWKLAPEEARRLLSEPPLVESVSIEFSFRYEQSHPDLKDWQFFDMLGREVDGSVVRIVVSEILSIWHLALVWEGGDSTAKKLAAQAAKNDKAGGGNMELSKKTISELQRLLGADLESEDDLVQAVTASLEAREQVMQDNAALLEKQAALAPAQAKLDALLQQKRERVLALYRRLRDGQEPAKSLVLIVARLGMDDLETLEQEAAADLEKKFPQRCQKCGSAEVSRRSSQETLPALEKKTEVDATAFMI